MGYEKHYGEEMSAERVQQVTMSKVYGWMTLALMASALAAIYTAGSETMLGLIFGSKIGFLGLMVAEVADSDARRSTRRSSIPILQIPLQSLAVLLHSPAKMRRVRRSTAEQLMVVWLRVKVAVCIA